jgi:hypothetical protein
MMLRKRVAAADFTTSFTSAAVTSRLIMVTRSTFDPSGTGTFSAMPSELPLQLGEIALHGQRGPGLGGMMFSTAERERRLSEWGERRPGAGRWCRRARWS